MIKSIQIKSEESTFLMPQENQEIEQHLTVSSSGRVWLSRFGFSLSSGHILLKREYAKIAEDRVSTLFAYLAEYSRHPSDLCACDTGNWTLTIRYDDRPSLTLNGSMIDQVYAGDVNVSTWIRRHIPLQDLIAFGDEEA